MEELLDTNGPPWWPMGMGVGGRCAPRARKAEGIHILYKPSKRYSRI